MQELLEQPTVTEAILFKQLPNAKVECGLCKRRCVVSPREKGYCQTRLNIDGKLYTLVSGDLSALESRPIEIKPLFHYWPGSSALTYSTWSCNFTCAWCQNYRLSRRTPNPTSSNYLSPQAVVNLALEKGDKGLCASFQEPTLLTDWTLKVFEKARKRGLYCCYVSNGYMTEDALRVLQTAGLDGLKIDVKGDAETYREYCGRVDVEKVWRTVREATLMGFHVEVVNLIITGVNDDEACTRWIIERHIKEAGIETPIHFSRYFPTDNFHNPSTKVEILERAYLLAQKLGILYPYLGNVRGHKYENTYCPNCQEKLIQRFGYKIISYKVTTDKRCPKCQQAIAITGRHIPQR